MSENWNQGQQTRRSYVLAALEGVVEADKKKETKHAKKALFSLCYGGLVLGLAANEYSLNVWSIEKVLLVAIGSAGPGYAAAKARKWHTAHKNSLASWQTAAHYWMQN